MVEPQRQRRRLDRPRLGGDDRVVGEDRSEDIDGGAGNDYLEGGKGHDTLTGGPGKDIIFGDETDTSCNASFPESCVRYGNDVIQARDGEVDQISCGPGTDRAVVDAIDVVAADCETVERGGPSQDGTTAPGGGAARRRSSAALALVGRPRLKAALRSGLTLRLTGAKPGKTTITARQGTPDGRSARATVRTDGTATIRLRFTKAAVKPPAHGAQGHADDHRRGHADDGRPAPLTASVPAAPGHRR